MITIHHLPKNIDSFTLAMIRHKTWITVNDRQYESKLLNQYDLAEVVEGAHEALTPTQRLNAYRRWLWKQMQDEYGVVWRELCTLVDAYDDGKEIVITVHADSIHADVIRNAICWMASNTESAPLPHFTGQRMPVRLSGNDETELPDEHWPLDHWRHEFQPWRVRWIFIDDRCLPGYLYDLDAVQTAIVPNIGLVNLGRDPGNVMPCWDEVPQEWIDEVQSMIADLEPDNIPLRVEQTTGKGVPDDIRYAQWHPEALEEDETALSPSTIDRLIGRALPEVVWRNQGKRPYFLRRAAGPHVRPVIRWQPGQRGSVRALDVQAQADDRYFAWQPVNRQQWQAMKQA